MWRAPEGPEGTGGLRDRPLRAAGSRAAISRAAGPDGARNTNVTTSKHAAAPPERRTRPGCWWAAAKPGRASRRRAQARVQRRRRCGGCRRVRRARAGFEIDHSEPQARVWRSRGRPDPTAPATPASPQANTRQPHRSEGAGRVLAGGVRAWPGFETTRPATDQPPCATVVEGAGGSGGHGRASRSTAPSEARVRRSRGRPGPTAPATQRHHK